MFDRRRFAVLAVAATLALAPTAFAERDPAALAACMTKQLRKVNGSESGRASAILAHFECFPGDARAFDRVFEGAGPLAGDPSPHFELFFAARPSVNEREWSTKAIGALAGAEWSGAATRRFALLLRINIKSRPTAPLDAAARLDDAALRSFWRVLYDGDDGFQPDFSVCKGKPEHRACASLAALSR